MPPRRAGGVSKEPDVEQIDDEMRDARNKLKEKFGGGDANRVGGKGTARRKKVGGHKSATSDDKKVAVAVKRMQMTTIPGIEEVMIYKEDKEVLVFSSPKVQAAPPANTYLVMGQPETKNVEDVVSKTAPAFNPSITPDIINNLKAWAHNASPSDVQAALAAMGDPTAVNPDKTKAVESMPAAKSAEAKATDTKRKTNANATSDSGDVYSDSDEVDTFDTAQK